MTRLNQANSVRQVCRYDLEGGAFVQILIGGDVSTALALDRVDELIQLKREELAKSGQGKSIKLA